MLRVVLVTDPYASCQRCLSPATKEDPLFKFGQYVEWVTLHKSCFDIVVKGTEELFEQYKRLPDNSNGDSGH